jgi:hypothetical protein
MIPAVYRHEGGRGTLVDLEGGLGIILTVGIIFTEGNLGSAHVRGSDTFFVRAQRPFENDRPSFEKIILGKGS